MDASPRFTSSTPDRMANHRATPWSLRRAPIPRPTSYVHAPVPAGRNRSRVDAGRPPRQRAAPPPTGWYRSPFSVMTPRARGRRVCRLIGRFTVRYVLQDKTRRRALPGCGITRQATWCQPRVSAVHAAARAGPQCLSAAMTTAPVGAPDVHVFAKRIAHPRAHQRLFDNRARGRARRRSTRRVAKTSVWQSLARDGGGRPLCRRRESRRLMTPPLPHHPTSPAGRGEISIVTCVAPTRSILSDAGWKTPVANVADASSRQAGRVFELMQPDGRAIESAADAAAFARASGVA